MDLPAFLANVKWKAELAPELSDELPYVTHSGELELLGHRLRCYRLNTGQAIFDADDFNAFMADWLRAPTQVSERG